MDDLAVLLATISGWVVLGLLVWHLWPIWWGFLRFDKYLPDLHSQGPLPSVSVLVPARNEAAALRLSLSAFRALNYPELEVIFVNDRSTDETGALLEEVARSDPRVCVIHVEQLPPGWLGKNYANHLASQRASGQWLLFTDADVHLDPSSIRDAVLYAEQHRLDHLVLVPHPGAASWWEQVALVYFALVFSIVTKGSLVRYRLFRSAYIGIGAFNLIRREVYERIGGHEVLRLEVADDVMLGRLVKAFGFRQDVLLAGSKVRVRWQVGVRGIIGGLEKNAFAGTGFRLGRALAAAAAQLLVFLGPLAALWLSPGRLAWAVAIGITAATTAGLARTYGHSWTAGLGYPLGCVIFVVALVRSAFLAYWRGGIVWRDTAYSLERLRAFRRGLEATLTRLNGSQGVRTAPGGAGCPDLPTEVP
jgi:hypothetical protein